ncbi:MAG: transcription elongation regulator [Marteilia pararefringens]
MMNNPGDMMMNNPMMPPMVQSMMANGSGVMGGQNFIPFPNMMQIPQQQQQQQQQINVHNLDLQFQAPLSEDYQNIDFEHDVWLKALSDDNKDYYVEVKSRKTQWEAPENPVNQILDHKDYEGLKTAYARWSARVNANSTEANVIGANSTSDSIINLPKDPKTGKYVVPSEVIEWSEHKSGDSIYYYNSRTKKSVWEKPDVLVKWEKDKTIPIKSKSEKETTGEPNSGASKTAESDSQAAKMGEKAAEESQSKKINNFKLTLKIPGTNWHVVKPSKGKIFYYNESTHSSTYNLHSELKSRDDIEELKDKLNKNFEIKMKELEEENERHLNLGTCNSGRPSEENRSQKGADVDHQESSPKREKKSEDDQLISETLKRYETMPLAGRQSIFYELLKEKKVSAFSTWKFELHKIVNDDRYLCLSSSDRRDVFDKYCKDRANEEKQEKENQIREIKLNFETLLKDSKVDRLTSFLEFSAKHSKDPRFKAVEKKKERERLFDSYQFDLKQQHVAKQKYRDSKKAQFMQLLKEQCAKYNNKLPNSFREARKLFESDSRYKSIESKSTRLKYFQEFQSNLDNHHNSSSSHNGAANHHEKRLSAESSLFLQQKIERDKMQVIQKELCGILSSILVDVCKDPSLVWSDIRHKVHDDPRWSQCKKMTKKSRDITLEDHASMLTHKYQNIFHSILTDLKVNVGSEFTDQLQENIKKHPSYSKISTWGTETLKNEFSGYIKKMRRRIIDDFKQLLLETKIITYKTNRQLEENPGMFTDIIAILEKDQRYLIMNKHMKEERRNLLISHIEKMERLGAPPSIHVSK